MNAGILKVGTMPMHHFFVRTDKRLSDYAPGDKITFREQEYGSKWERGIVREIIIDIPRIERI
jgi:hypothetical protein